MAFRLQTIITSTRPGRVGPSVAKWFDLAARDHGGFDVELVDLADFNLPVFDEPVHPMRQQYQHEHTKRWSASVKQADAFVFVMPEYNYGVPPSLVNALNFLVLEWNYTPAGFVSYGGISGGMRGVQAVKPLLTALRIMPLNELVAVPMVSQHLNEQKQFQPTDIHKASVKPMLDELLRWAEALKGLRATRR